MKTVDEIRREKLALLIKEHGTSGALAELLGMSPSQLSQWKSASKHSDTGKPRRMSSDSARYIEEKCGKPSGWMDTEENLFPQNVKKVLIAEPENPGLLPIKMVKLRLSAGISGFAFDQQIEDGYPIYRPKSWFEKKGFIPEKLIAVKIKGQSMEPLLSEGNLVVINTADTKLQDGEVYAVNYEGEAVVKRMVRDIGQWWLSSDNPDQRKYHRKVCQGDACVVIGRIVHSEKDWT